MAFDRDVTIDINADISGYTTSLSQAIASTDNFSKAADTLLGKVTKVNGITMALVKATNSFTGANKLAVTQAAAYQQKLAGIETTAKVTGQNFHELERTTKRFARDFPIGLDGAVETIQNLQESGVTANKEIASLGKGFINLGAATGQVGPAIGKQMLELNRTFGKSYNEFSAMSDSLVSVTKNFGANAGSVVSFAKAIAPVASTVGMSETSVLGLSTAMSRLGEDGYRAANAFNKVLLDLQKSVSTGSPEIREYAAVLGVTQDNLKEMMKNNPTDVIVKFTEAIQKQGSASIRTLSNLGLEGVSTFKAISALSREGNLQEIIDTSAKSFGNGSTEEAASTALGGVSDQVQKLGSSMEQAVANTGEPYLKWLGKVIEMANGAAGAVANFTGSEGFQKAGGVVAPAAAATSAVSSAVGVASTVAFGKILFQGLRDSRVGTDFRAGYADGRGTGAVSQTGPMASRFGSAFGVVRGPGNVQDPNMPRQSWLARTGQGLYRGAANVAALNYRFQAETINRAMGMQDPSRITPQGIAVRDALKGLNAAVAGGDKAAIAAQTAAVRNATAAYLKHAGATQALTVEFGAAAKAAGMFAAQTTKAGLSRVGSMLGGLGITPQMVAIMGGMMAFSAIKGEADKRGEQLASYNVEGKGGYDTFNKFAEQAGLATRGLVTFTDAVNTAANKLNSENKDLTEAFTLTAEEFGQTQSAGYEPVFKPELEGGENAKQLATLARIQLGAAPSPEAASRYMMDIANQYGKDIADEVGKSLADTYRTGSTDFLKDALRFAGGNRNYDWAAGARGGFGIFAADDAGVGGKATELGELYMTGIREEITRQTASIEQTQGIDAANQYRRNALESLFNQGANDLNPNTGRQTRMAATEIIAGLTNNADNDDFRGALQDAMNGRKSFEEFQRTWSGMGDEVNKNLASVKQSGAKVEVPAAQTDAANIQSKVNLIVGQFQNAGKAGYDLSTALYAAEKAAAKAGVAVDSLARGADGAIIDRTTGAKLDVQMTDTELAINDAKNAPEDQTKQNIAGRAIAAQLLKSGGAAEGIVSLMGQMGATTPSSTSRGGLSAAMGYMQTAFQMQSAGMSTADQQNEKLRMAQMARQLGVQEDPEVEKQRQAMIDGEAEVYQQRLGFARQFLQQKMQVDLQLLRAEEDYNLQRSHANRDFNRQQERAEQSYERTRFRARRDFNRQMQLSQQDFDIQRAHQLRDHNKQIERMMADAASNMFDPYQRIRAKDIWDASGLANNLMDQAKAIASQMANVQKLIAGGLSQDTIDQLGLGKSENASQVQALVNQMATDPAALARLEAASKAKSAVAGKASTDESMNKDFRWQEADFKQSLQDMNDAFDLQRKNAKDGFKISMNDMAQDFKIQMKQAVTDFRISMSDMAQQFARSRTRALQDLANFGKEVSGSGETLGKAFTAAVSKLPSASKNAMISNTRIMVDEMKDTFSNYFNDQFKSFGLSADVLGADKSKAGAEARAVNAAAKAVTQWNAVHKDAQDIAAYTSQGGGKFLDWKTGRDFWITPDGKVTFDKNAPHMSFAEGGIATRPVNALIGEAGHSEAVIPLNERGANVLASAMGRYVNAQDVLRSRVQPYASSVSNNSAYHYDQKTVFSGPVTVQSQDPTEMARKLAARARRARLAQPVGSY